MAHADEYLLSYAHAWTERKLQAESSAHTILHRARPWNHRYQNHRKEFRKHLIAAAFVAKVVVDTDAKNKNKQIDSLTQRLSFYTAEVEPRLRLLAIKTDSYQKIWNKSSSYSTIIKEIYSYVDNPGADLTIKASDGKVSIFGTEDLTLLRNLEEKLRNSPSFTSVNFGSLSIDGSDVQDAKGEYSVSAVIKDSKRPQIWSLIKNIITD